MTRYSQSECSIPGHLTCYSQSQRTIPGHLTCYSQSQCSITPLPEIISLISVPAPIPICHVMSVLALEWVSSGNTQSAQINYIDPDRTSLRPHQFSDQCLSERFISDLEQAENWQKMYFNQFRNIM